MGSKPAPRFRWTTSNRLKDLNLYCISTPFQLVSAIEARHRFPAKQNVLIIRDVVERREEHRSQVQALSSRTQWDEIIHWPVHQGSRISKRWEQAHFTRRLAGRFADQVHTYLMAGFRQPKNHMLRGALRPQRTIVLDDGVGTLFHFREFLSQGKYLSSWLETDNPLGRLLQIVEFALAGTNKDEMKVPMELFTCFELPDNGNGTLVHRHSFESLGKLRENQSVDASRVDYLGSPLSERAILESKSEINLIDRIRQHYAEDSRQLRYIAHRDDSERKLRELQNRGIKTIRLDTPAEFYYVSTEQLPGTFASTISTALHNLFMIFPDIQADLFPLPFNEMLSRSEHAEQVTRQYQSMGIQAVELT